MSLVPLARNVCVEQPVRTRVRGKLEGAHESTIPRLLSLGPVEDVDNLQERERHW